MTKLNLKRGINLCYPILESTKESFFEKVCKVSNEKKCIIELRIDCLLSAGFSIEQIIDFVSYIKGKCTRKKLIATIRSCSEGGKVDLDDDKYFYFIKMLYLKSKVNAIDVEYKFYIKNKEAYDELFATKKKDIILSIHIFDRVLLINEYKKIFKDMINTKANIVKFAIKTYTKEDLFAFMDVARKTHKFFVKARKKVIFIALGEIGKVSRIFPEYTYTSIVFLNAYEKEDNNIGQISRKVYNKCRKLLAKSLKS